MSNEKPPFEFTKARIDKLPIPQSGQEFYFDTVVRGFGVRVSAGGTKSYIAQGRHNGAKHRVTIGGHGAFVPETARKEAQRLLVEISRGVDHAAKKKEEESESTSLRTIFEDFKDSRNLRPKTVQVYSGAINRCFSDWLDKPFTSITKDMIEQRYKKLLNRKWQRGSNGVAQAHQAMRTLRAVLNYAAAKYEDGSGRSILPENPVKRLSQAKTWKAVPDRESIIQPTQLKDWYKALRALDNDITRDYLLLCLLTGLRRNEATRLRWVDIDFEAKTLRIPAENSKNHLEHRLPLSTLLLELLRERSKIVKIGKDSMPNPYVFPGNGATGHLVEFRNDIAKIAKASSIKFMTHDLRRTFLTIADMLDIPHYALKKLANHKTSDITGRYIQADVERLREPMQRITDFIMQKAGIELQDVRKPEAANVIPLVS